MQICLLKAKLHNATITHVEPDYEGSCALDGALLERAGIHEFEQIQIYNLTSGDRLTTYVIRAAERGKISLNGAAALKGKPGQRVIICSYCCLDEREAHRHQPTILRLEADNSVSAPEDEKGFAAAL